MNLAIRGIEGQILHDDTFHNDRFPDLKADYHAKACARFIMAALQAGWAP